MTLTPTNPLFSQPVGSPCSMAMATMVPTMCFCCKEYETDLRSVSLPTKHPRFMIISCSNPVCNQACLNGAIHFFRSTPVTMMVNSFRSYQLRLPVNVQRTSGDVEEWLLYGFEFNDTNVSSVVATSKSYEILKHIPLEKFVELNSAVMPFVQEALDKTVDSMLDVAQTLWTPTEP